jgi:hypothetical protein
MTRNHIEANKGSKDGPTAEQAKLSITRGFTALGNDFKS